MPVPEEAPTLVTGPRDLGLTYSNGGAAWTGTSGEDISTGVTAEEA